MASAENGGSSTGSGGNMMIDSMEAAFQNCLSILTKEDNFNTQDREDIRSHADASVLQFMDYARQVEQSFLQKRLLLSVHRPDFIVKEDILELKQELVRKEELIKRTQDKIALWKGMLSDLQHARADMPPAMMDTQRPAGPGALPAVQQYRAPGPPGYMVRGPVPPGGYPGPGHQANLPGHLAFLEKTTSNIT